jgi:hypothetical protein
VIPKGVKEPELSLRDSASKEALEEAAYAAVSTMSRSAITSTEKWGGVCKVAVFPMEVSESVPEDEWEENHRERRWVDAKEARRLLDEKALRKLVGKLEKKVRRALSPPACLAASRAGFSSASQASISRKSFWFCRMTSKKTSASSKAKIRTGSSCQLRLCSS